jgi:hypothetical protein
VLAHSISHEINTNFLLLQHQKERKKKTLRNAEQKADLKNREIM